MLTVKERHRGIYVIKLLEGGTKEAAQLIECLADKREDPQHPNKKPSMVHLPVVPELRQQKQMDPRGPQVSQPSSSGELQVK